MPTMREFIVEDIRSTQGGGLRKLVGVLILDPLTLVILYRISHALYLRGLRLPAWWLHSVAFVLYGSDVHPGASLGARLKFAHTSGVVIGGGVVAGDDLQVYAGVTVGNRKGWDFPQIGQAVTLYSGACVIGGVTLGDRVQVGANAVVLDDIPAGRTAIGVPAVVQLAKVHPLC